MRTIHVVTPAFNSAEYIERTLASVALQAGDFAVHHHVQDGGSDDATLDILKRWSQCLAYGVLPQLNRGVRFTFASEPDTGMYDAIAKGFKALDADPDDWITWINSDDILMPGAMATLCGVDRDLGTERVAWVGGRTRNAEDHEILSEIDHRQASGIIRHGLCDGLHFDFVQQEGTFFRARLWGLISPQRDFSSYRAAGDWNLWRLFAQHADFHQFGFSLGEFMVRAEQKSAVLKDVYSEEIDKTVSFRRRSSALEAVHKSPPPRFIITRSGPERALVVQTKETGPILQHWVNNSRKREEYSRSRFSGMSASINAVRSGAPLGPTGAQAGSPDEDFIIHDADWQFPAITEQHAFSQAKRLLPRGSGAVYLAFPWATFIDLQNNDRPEKAEALADVLREKTMGVPAGTRLVTVCQHIHFKRALPLFEEAGVTDVFWSHAVKGETRIGDIQVHPFPLYPVQTDDASMDSERSILFSFIGARANKWYLSNVRDWILDLLGAHPRGLVVGRDDWHYNRVVYDLQIRGHAAKADGLVDDKASEQFKAVMRQSVFALCPSGSGPNSIRLWEALGAGTIPVILADSWAPPGKAALWEAAAVFCEESPEAVKALPARLEALAAEPGRLEAMRHAGRQLWSLYGPDGFIYDLQALFQQAASWPRPAKAPSQRRLRVAAFGRHAHRMPVAYPPVKTHVEGAVDFVEPSDRPDVLAVGFDLDLKENAAQVRALQKAHPRLSVTVLSEEPLWDTVWSAGHLDRTGEVPTSAGRIPVTVLNHFTSDIYEFDRIPYFVTTSDKFALRYAARFSANRRLSPADWLERWRAAPVAAAFYCENRENPKYDFSDPGRNIFGLCGYRTRLARVCEAPGVMREGKGWSGDRPRQALPDWHLDKLAALDGRVRMVGALENTHAASYITEKLFDAYAVGGIPVYWAAPGHRVRELVPEGSFLNVHGLSEDEAARGILSFEPDLQFAERYAQAQDRLHALFADPAIMRAERTRAASAIIRALTGAGSEVSSAASRGDRRTTASA